jgi:hypothetical protein
MKTTYKEMFTNIYNTFKEVISSMKLYGKIVFIPMFLIVFLCFVICSPVLRFIINCFNDENIKNP